MKVTVLYFAAVREIAGHEEETVVLPDDVRTVGAFAKWIGERHAGLGARMASVRIARNEEFATGDDAIGEGDVLALIPPVAGG